MPDTYSEHTSSSDWPDSRLISIGPFAPHSFDALHKHRNIKTGVTPEQYAASLQRLAAIADVTIHRIVYCVNNLAVTGAMLVPRDAAPKAHPLLIYNRGGTAEFGILTAFHMLSLARFAREGYIIFASNYRGNDGGEGRDEFGGADLQDVLILLDIAQRHPAWDGKNRFMYGESRGGMMTYLALKHDAPLTAAATIAAPACLRENDMHRPDMLAIYRQFIPQFELNPYAALQERSALTWVDRIHVPLLMLHGTADARVHVSHSLELDAALTAQGKPHKTVIYDGGDHFLTQFRSAAMEEIKQWFAKYRI